MEGEKINTSQTQTDSTKDDLVSNADSKGTSTEAVSSNCSVDEWIDILGNGQLKKKVIKEGENGTRPNRADSCTLKIVGKLKDGTVVEEHEDITIQLGDVEVIQGLDLAIALMNVGEIAEIEVASRFAYGSLGREPDIPPDATIWYTTELKSVQLEPDTDTFTIAKRKEIGNRKRERGNWWFIRDEPTLAITCYRRALDFLLPSKSNSNSSDEMEDNATDTELQALLEDRMKVYNNLAAAQMKTQAYDAALKSVENVLICQPQNVKALFRKGKILHYKGEHSQAYATLLHAARLEPETKAIQQELAILREKSAKDARHEKNLYRKMLGTDKNNLARRDAKYKNSSKGSSKLAWSLIGGAVATVIGVLVYRFSS